MVYKRVAFDGEALLSDAPRETLAALGVTCFAGGPERDALFVSENPAAVDLTARWLYGAALPPAMPAPRTTCASRTIWRRFLHGAKPPTRAWNGCKPLWKCSLSPRRG